MIAAISNEVDQMARTHTCGRICLCILFKRDASQASARAFRRRGIARALLGRMLQDDRAYGATLAVLLASHTGAKLYPLIGYQQIGELLLYTPKNKTIATKGE